MWRPWKKKPEKSAKPPLFPDNAIAAAAAGNPVEITSKTLIEPDRWIRAAQVLLAIAAVCMLFVFVVTVLADQGMRNSSRTHTFQSKTGDMAGSAKTVTVTRKPPTGAKSNLAVTGTPVASYVRKTVVRPRTIDVVAKKDRPSDGMATLIGLIALALALVAATLPRLRSFEFHGLKVNLSGEAELAQSQGRAAELIKGKAVELSLANSAVDVAASAKQTEEERNPDATVAILAWIASANAELTRKTREKQLQAVARGSDPAEAARLSDDEIAKIVNATQPEVAG